MIKFGNFEFIFGIKVPKVHLVGEGKYKTIVVQNRGQFFTFILDWGQFILAPKDKIYDCVVKLESSSLYTIDVQFHLMIFLFTPPK